MNIFMLMLLFLPICFVPFLKYFVFSNKQTISAKKTNCRYDDIVVQSANIYVAQKTY